MKDVGSGQPGLDGGGGSHIGRDTEHLPPPAPPPASPGAAALAEPLAPVVPAAAEAAAAIARQRRGFDWKGFQLAPVFAAGCQIGVGATCGRHFDSTDGAQVRCKKQVTFGQEPLTESQCIAKLKLWLIRGHAIRGEWPRRDHVKENVRAYPVISSEELDHMMGLARDAHNA